MMGRYDEIVRASMESLLYDESLYRGLTDHEASILTQWAEGRLGLAISGAPNSTIALEWAGHEVVYLRALFGFVVEATDEPKWDRGMVIEVITSLLSRLFTWRT